MCIRDRAHAVPAALIQRAAFSAIISVGALVLPLVMEGMTLAVSYTHLRAHETVLDLVCRLLLEKKNKKTAYYDTILPQIIIHHEVDLHVQ